MTNKREIPGIAVGDFWGCIEKAVWELNEQAFGKKNELFGKE